MGFLASAVLPASAYLVGHSIISSAYQVDERHQLTQTSEPLRMSHSRSQRCLCLHPASTRLAILEHQLNSRRRARNRAQRIIWRTRSDCRRLDLQKQ